MSDTLPARRLAVEAFKRTQIGTPEHGIAYRAMWAAIDAHREASK